MGEDYCPGYEEKDRAQSSEGDHDAFVELNLMTIGRAVFGTKVRLVHCNLIVLLCIFHLFSFPV